MKEQNGRASAFFILIGLPLTFLAMLITVYVALYGWTSPFEVRLKTEIKPGKVVSDSEMAAYKMTLLDSVRYLEKNVRVLVDSAEAAQRHLQAWLDSLAALQSQKKRLERTLARLQEQLATLQTQVDAEKQARMNRLTKILQSMTPENLDSLYVASLDDHTLMDIIAMAKAQQAAAILSRVDPKRAARLTARYVNPR